MPASILCVLPTISPTFRPQTHITSLSLKSRIFTYYIPLLSQLPASLLSTTSIIPPAPATATYLYQSHSFLCFLFPMFSIINTSLICYHPKSLIYLLSLSYISLHLCISHLYSAHLPCPSLYITTYFHHPQCPLWACPDTSLPPSLIIALFILLTQTSFLFQLEYSCIYSIAG